MPQESKWYRNTSELPFNKFIECLVDGNLSALIISGYPTPAEIQGAWLGIAEEYHKATADHEYKVFLKLYKDIEELKITIDQVVLYVGVLRQIKSQYFIDELNDILRLKLNLNWEDPASYHEQLNKCIRRNAGFRTSLQIKEKNFEAIRNKNEGLTNKVDRAYFISMLITLSDHAKYPIHDNIMTAEYCERLRRYNKYVEDYYKNQKQK